MALMKYSEIGLAVAVLLGAVFRKWGKRLPAAWDRAGFKAYVLALQLGILLLCVPAYLGVWHSSNADLGWMIWDFLDKRWLVSLYWLAIAVFVIFPPCIHAVLAGIPRPPTTEELPTTSRNRPPWLRVLVRASFAVAMTWFYAGPPWNLATHHRFIDYHEQVHLGPLQAIAKGYTPYLGPASTHYGPGSQIFFYAFMKWTGQFTILGFRHANASIHLIAVLIFALFIFQVLKIWEAALVMLIAMTYSPLRFLSFVSGGGALDGFYGWTNDLRYLGILLVAGTLPFLLMRWKDRRYNAPALFLGIVWGLFTWMAQENLAGGFAAAGLVFLLLWLSGSVQGKAIVQVAGNLLAGCAIAWLPVLLYYTLHGSVLTYLRWYFLYPAAVSAGFSNTNWASKTTDSQYYAFLFTAPFLVIVAVCTLCDVPRLRLRSPLTSRQVTLLAATMALAASYQSALFRSDSPHLLNTLTALPLVIFLACSDVPRWLVRTPKWQHRIRWAFVIAVLVIYPLGQNLAYPYDTLAMQQMARFTPVVYPALPPEDPRIPFQRATRYLSDEPRIYMDAVKVRDFLEDASEIRDIVGNRRTLVLSHPAVVAGFLSFMADLTPAPYLIDEEMMVLHAKLQREVEADFRKNVSACEAVIAKSVLLPEVKIFLEAHPGAQTINRSIAGKPYFIFLAEPSHGRN